MQRQELFPVHSSIEQNAEQRKQNFEEVSLELDQTLAATEASRCLECKDLICIDGCPVNVDIKAFIQFINERNFVEAVQKIRESNYLPAICGRVCPHEEQCEQICTLGRKHQPVAVGKLERFVPDYKLKSG